ncbi:MAG: regulatory protein DeoR [Nitrospirae bacterium]|nr:MAG: regulatory protein DeoR [Nitrospirota bacterium]
MQIYKFDSLITILRKLDGREPVTVNSLMDDLEISQRTTFRYIQTLQVAGYPIIYERKKNSYAFSEGYSLRKPNLSIEETPAFALAKKLLGNFGAGMEQSLKRIEDKISTKSASLPKHIILSGTALPPETEKYLGIIHGAITNFQKVEIKYNALHSKAKSQRKVDPCYLFFNEGFWYLRGYCHTDKALRTFALDRITSLKVLNEHFLPKKVLPEDELSASFGTWLDGEPVEVVLIFDEEVKERVLRRSGVRARKKKSLKTAELS